MHYTQTGYAWRSHKEHGRAKRGALHGLRHESDARAHSL